MENGCISIKTPNPIIAVAMFSNGPLRKNHDFLFRLDLVVTVSQLQM